MADPIPLRALTHRLNATPVEELPPVAQYLSTVINESKDILSVSHDARGPPAEAELAQLVHKLKTRITSLLQDKTSQGRYTGVVLVKASVEAGQWEILRNSVNWIRSVISILGRPEPEATKNLCMVTLTKIFLLTQQYPTLIRELSTPNLPNYITTCLNQISVKSSTGQQRELVQDPFLLEFVFSSFLELIPRHPTIFRPFSSLIHSLIIPVLGAPSPGRFTSAALEAAQLVFIALHHCAPKNTGSEEWIKASKSTIATLHQTCDHLFRAAVEYWESNDPEFKHSTTVNHNRPAGDDSPNALGLPPWHGIHAGAWRLRTLISLLSKFFDVETSDNVPMPVGMILDVTTRLFSMAAPKPKGDSGMTLRPEISREERESLWGELPLIHQSALDLLLELIETTGFGVMPIYKVCFEHALEAYKANGRFAFIRVLIYKIVGAVIAVVGPSLEKSHFKTIAPIVKAACEDLLPTTPPPSASTAQAGKQPGKAQQQRTANADAFLQQPNKEEYITSPAETNPELDEAARDLLPTVLKYVRATSIPYKLRVQIDRTAILIGHGKLMFASVMNPSTDATGKQPLPSILPFFAQHDPMALELAALLTPRMPMVVGPPPAENLVPEDSDEEEDDDVMDTGHDDPFESNITSTPSWAHKRAYPEEQVAEQRTTAHPEVPKKPRVEEPELTPTVAPSHVPATTSTPIATAPTVTSEAPAAVPFITPEMPGASVTSSVAETAAAATIPEKGASKPESIFAGHPTSTANEAAARSSAFSAVADAASGKQAAGGEDEDEESGDEIPTLNVESDSDESMD